MKKPKGPLTAIQLEILELLWDHPEGEASVAEIWKALAKRRDLARTTVLTHVDRLAKRGWLKRRKGETALHYRAAQDRETVMKKLATQFVDDYFEGSPSGLVAGLLGGETIDPEELDKLRKMIDEAEPNK